MEIFGVNMYGIWENHLDFKNGINPSDIWDGEYEDYIELDNGKTILLDRCMTIDDEWICGYSNIFPWNQKDNETPSNPKEVEEALWKKYKDYVNMTHEEFTNKICGISVVIN